MTKGVLNTSRDSSLLSVDVSELLRRPGATKHISMKAVLDGIAGELSRLREDSGLTLDLQLDALVDGIHVSGDVSSELDETCARCLRGFPESVQLQIDEVFVYQGESMDDDDAYEVVDEVLNLEPMLRDAVILALPLKPLCREDCKGLCATCGADRNEDNCGHDPARVDVRWDALARLSEEMEG